MGEPLRILRIQSRICIGGPALNTINLSAYMDASRFQTLLVGGRLEKGESSMEERAVDLGVPTYIMQEMGRAVHWYDDLKTLFAMIRLIRYFRPHIVHTHTAKAGAIGRVAAFLCRVPIRVHTFHGHVFEGYFGAVGNIAVRWAERILGLITHAVIAISPRQREDLVHRFRIVSARKCHIIRLGFQLEPLSNGQPGSLKRQLDLPQGIRLAAIIARLVPIKNHSLLLQAVAAWRQTTSQRPDQVRFLIIGDGELRQSLENEARQLGIEDWLIFTGWLTEMADVYADIDLNVLVSRNEGTPVSLIEGLASGVPVLTTDVGGVRDFVNGDCGTVVATDVQPQQLATHLKQWSDNPPHRLDPAQRHRIHELFGVSRLVSEAQDLYSQLLESKGMA